jgi:hypothetical protein
MGLKTKLGSLLRRQQRLASPRVKCQWKVQRHSRLKPGELSLLLTPVRQEVYATPQCLLSTTQSAVKLITRFSYPFSPIPRFCGDLLAINLSSQRTGDVMDCKAIKTRRMTCLDRSRILSLIISKQVYLSKIDNPATRSCTILIRTITQPHRAQIIAPDLLNMVNRFNEMRHKLGRIFRSWEMT